MMSSRPYEPKPITRLVLSLMLALQAAAAGNAQTPSIPAKPAEQPRGSGDGQHEGIKVHGHWVIDVRNADGSLAQHRDFENALQQAGAVELAYLLTRRVGPGTWSISLRGSPEACGTADVPRFCEIFEPQATHGGVPITAALDSTYQTANLVVRADGPLLLENRVVLSGTATASHDASIGGVTTRLGVCTATASLTSCTEWASGFSLIGNEYFTSASASTTGPFTPVPVKPGQIIQVTVTISFS